MVRRFIGLMLVMTCLMLLGDEVTSAQSPSATPYPCIVAPPMQLSVGIDAIIQNNNGVPLNIRDEASTYGSIIGQVETRTIVKVLDGPRCGRANNLYTWWQIQTPDGLTGWVAEGDAFRSSAQYFIAPLENSNVDPEGVNCGAAPPSRVDVGSFAVVDEGAHADVMLRDAPSGRILDFLQWGTVLEVVGGPRCGENNRLFKWWEVNTQDGLRGWVAEGDATQNPMLYFIRPATAQEVADAGYRTPLDPGCPASPPTILQPNDVVEVGENGGFPLILRSGPAGGRIGELEQGTLLTILSGPKCGNAYAWWEVSLEDGRRGWVAEGDDSQTPVVYFITLARAAATSPTASLTPTPTQPIVPTQIVIENPTPAAPLVVETPAGVQLPCQASPPARLKVGDPALVGSAGVPLRDLPDPTGNVVAMLPPESYMIVLSGPICGLAQNEYGWWQVRSEDGTVGWVQEGDASQSPAVYYVHPINVSE